MNSSALGSPVTAAIKLCLYFTTIITSVLIFFLTYPLGARVRQSVIFWHHRTNCRIAGFDIEIRGEMRREHPTVFVCNHVSYFDIPVIGSRLDGCFVAKAEVACWPVLGFLAKLQRTVFIERVQRRAADQRNELQERLAAGDNLILFPEGTSSDGNRVLPFKSSLFAIAQAPVAGKAVVVQPVSIAYTKLDGMPLGRYLRPFFAWYGDMDLASHIWQALGLGRCSVVVEFHPPVTIDDFGTRKALSAHCQRVVSHGVAVALADQPMPLPQPAEEMAA